MATDSLPSQEQAPLSEAQRLIDVFIAPSKTFTDLRINASWWAPFVISAIISVIFVIVVDQKIGFSKVWENQLRSQPKQAEKMEQMPADQRAKITEKQIAFTKTVSYSFSVLILVWYVIVASVLLTTLKFGLSAEVRFKTLLALVFYSSLPGLLKTLLAILSVVAGVSGDAFTFQNPVATNPGYFVDPATAPVLSRFLTSFDIFTFWVLALAAIGITCITKVKKGTAFAVVFGWYFVVVLIGVGAAAIFS